MAEKDQATPDAGEASFRKGNINFDVLEPENPAEARHRPAPKSDTPAEDLPSKRGIFDAGRRQNPVGTGQVVLWLLVFLISVIALVSILIFAQSVIWMLALPVLLMTLFWSAIMLGLYKARPR